MGSCQVPNVFPKGVPNSTFNPMCFAQKSSTSLTYIGRPKGEELHLSIDSSILGNLHSFNFFYNGANQIGSLQKKKESWTCEAPLTN